MANPTRGSLRERFLAAIAGQAGVPPVLAPDLTYWQAAHPLLEGNDLLATLRFHRELGVLAYYVYGSAL